MSFCFVLFATTRIIFSPLCVCLDAATTTSRTELLNHKRRTRRRSKEREREKAILVKRNQRDFCVGVTWCNVGQRSPSCFQVLGIAFEKERLCLRLQEKCFLRKREREAEKGCSEVKYGAFARARVSEREFLFLRLREREREREMSAQCFEQWGVVDVERCSFQIFSRSFVFNGREMWSGRFSLN